VIEKAVAPDERLGMVGQELHAALGHAAMSDARDHEACIFAAMRGRDRPAHIDKRQSGKSGIGETAMLGRRIGAAESGEMQSDMVGDPLAQLPRELGISRRGQDLDIAFAQRLPVPAGTGLPFTRLVCAVNGVR
jgi:hypothetical protein